MSANNQCVLIGRAGNNVSEDVKHLQSGKVVAEVRLAVNRPGKDAMGNPITDWFQIQYWDKQAERLAEFVKKGDLISVSGALRVDSWEKDGEKRTKVFVHGEGFQMLESRSAREQRTGAGGDGGSYGGSSGGSRQPAAAAAKSGKQEDFSQDFDLGSDELPPF